jgi:hypothetical protein
MGRVPAVTSQALIRQKLRKSCFEVLSNSRSEFYDRRRHGLDVDQRTATELIKETLMAHGISENDVDDADGEWLLNLRIDMEAQIRNEGWLSLTRRKTLSGKPGMSRCNGK